MSILDPMILNPSLLYLASRAANSRNEKQADGMMGGDPTGGMGGAPPPDPSMGGAASPTTGGGGDQATQIAQQVMAMMGTQGGAGGPGGKGGGKKAEQQIVDTKLWIIQYLLVQLCQKEGITLPPSVVIGPPPDPMAMQAAQTDQQGATGAGAPMPGDPNAGMAPQGGGAPAQDPNGGIPGMQGMSPMDASQGPLGKQGSDNSFKLGRPTDSPDFSVIVNSAKSIGKTAAQIRKSMGY